MSTKSEEQNFTYNAEKKIRFKPTKVLFSDIKVEELFNYEKSDILHDEADHSKREKFPSLLSFLHVELTRGYVLEHDEERYSARREKVYSFMRIPREVEKFMIYGFMQCTDSFLFVCTFLPLRFILALWAFITRPIARCFGFYHQSSKGILTPAEICDLLKATLVITASLLMFYIDTNMMYHLIKSQSVIKLYIFFNMLEVADRLFSAFGQDIIDALFWTATEPRDRRREHLGVIPHLLFAIAYVFGKPVCCGMSMLPYHCGNVTWWYIISLYMVVVVIYSLWSSYLHNFLTIAYNNELTLLNSIINTVAKFFKQITSLWRLLVLFQATTLNVAINSDNKALLTIMMSNNFVELKGSVFKKFDKNNLFQVACSDVRERFHLVVLLFVVALQTMKEYAWITRRFWVLLPDCVMVLIAEIFVDWVKHAFITRFNELQLDVYRDYRISLAYDMVQTRQKHAFSDHSDLVARRMGFIPLPLAVVMVRIIVQSVYIGDFPSTLIVIIAYLCLVSFRVVNSILILGIACNLIAKHKQEKVFTQSPSANRANSPVSVSNNKMGINKDWFRDSATSPLKPTVDQPHSLRSSPISLNGFVNNSTMKNNGNGQLDSCPDCSLGSTAIFSNSTVDLKNVSLNEELLKVDGENIQIEGSVCDQGEMLTRSEPNINSEFVEEILDSLDREIGDGLKKRAESEPSLVICNESEDIKN